MTATATARAHANIALVKYWGKRDATLNLPAAGSLSLTLSALTTTSTVTFGPTLANDQLELDGAPADATRLSKWLDILRERAGINHRARITSANNFPTASGLASSASAYASLALAASRAAGLELSGRELTELARRGSGSAGRSLFGGFVQMHPAGYAEQVDVAADWDLRMVIGIVGGGVTKKISSRDAMTTCAETSPLYAGWLDSVPPDLADARAAIAGRDLAELGKVTERSALTMHAAAIASRPSIRYWQPATLEILDAMAKLPSCYCTMDAGPHVKVLTDSAHATAVADRLRELPGVTDVIVSEIGGPAEIL